MIATAQKNSQEQAIDAAKNCVQALLAAEQTTDDLTTAIRLWEDDQSIVGSMLDTRAALCRRVTEAAFELSAAVKLTVAETGGIGKELGAAIEQVEAEQARLLGKQMECQTALAGELKEVEVELRSMTRHRELKNVYHRPPARNDARFLDNRH